MEKKDCFEYVWIKYIIRLMKFGPKFLLIFLLFFSFLLVSGN